MRNNASSQNGSILVSLLIIMVILTTMLFGLISLGKANYSRSVHRLLALQAQYAAESGADAALAILNNSDENYSGTASDTSVITNGVRFKATYSVDVVNNDSNTRTITAIGKVYSPATSATPKVTRTIEVKAERTSSSLNGNILSRNIVEVASSVKNIFAKDVHINEYIKMNKNSTTFVAESITVADRKNGADDCSIEGPGGLGVPATFSDPSQNHVLLRLAYNNCATLSDASKFNISDNRNDIEKVQSTNVPWSYRMDGTYAASPTGCNDLTASGTTITLPSTGNTKKTHYPDTGSGVSSACSSGSINLGTKTVNVTDHVHIRADLCSASTCSPTFNNPSTDMKFIFIEGTINFENVYTSPGSGPLALIAYAADPDQTSSEKSSCPLGQAIRLGQAGSAITNAPAAYFVAVNGGLCIDKTKYPDNTKSLGGVSGKNLYVSSSPGQNFDLRFDPLFPTGDIPINLSWKATLYRRL